MYKNSLRCTV